MKHVNWSDFREQKKPETWQPQKIKTYFLKVFILKIPQLTVIFKANARNLAEWR